MPQQNNHYHLIGIGGIGMSGIAQLLLKRRIRVSGSDIKESRITQDLKGMGAEIYIGHNAGNIKGADLVVYSSAIGKDNPEIIQAIKSGVPLIKRAEALAGLMKDKIVITVTGSHGKTTTTSLASYLLLNAGLHPTIAVGGFFQNIDTNAYLGDGDYFIAEADESDGSFLHYLPNYSIITNVDYEHLDYYKTFRDVLDTFAKFIRNTRQDGCIFACADDLNLFNLLKGYKGRVVLYGTEKTADIYPENIEFKAFSSEFDCFCKNKFIERFHLALGGMHNILNSLSVIALGLELGLALECMEKTLSGYKGAGRRMQVKSKTKKCTVIDDYAHHPTEVKATLAAVKTMQPRRIIAVFQPHRFSRTKLLQEEFGRCFDAADYIIITDIYAANEPPLEGVTARLIYDKIKKNYPDKIAYFLPKGEIVQQLLKIITDGDVIVTLGAGDIGRICDGLVERLKGAN